MKTQDTTPIVNPESLTFIFRVLVRGEGVAHKCHGLAAAREFWLSHPAWKMCGGPSYPRRAITVPGLLAERAYVMQLTEDLHAEHDAIERVEREPTGADLEAIEYARARALGDTFF